MASKLMSNMTGVWNPGYPVPCGDSNSEPQDIAVKGLCQFTTEDGVRFFPANNTVKTLVPGIYDIQMSANRGLFFEKLSVKTDGLLRFPEANSDKVIEEIKKFWTREQIFDKYNLLYKRGILLYGPPGSGKTSTIQLAMQDVVERNGVVFKFTNPSLFIEGVRQFRQIQNDTPLVVLMEDIDGIFDMYNQSEVLNILDGVDQVRKVVFLATTNYPEMLGERILNRPSRFDKRFKMGHPTAESRKLYFEHIIDDEAMTTHNIDIDRWVDETDGMSIAHLKELFVAHVILGNEYDEAVKTLQKMIEEHPKSSEDYHKPMGLGAIMDGKSSRKRR